MAVSKAFKKELVTEFGKDAKNTGSVEVQVAILTAEINSLTNHINSNKKDSSSKKSLYTKVSKRHSLLDYLKDRDIEKYRELVKKLNLRN